MYSMQSAKKYSTKEMIKGKMVVLDYGEGPKLNPLARVLPWPAAISGVTALSVDGSFREEDETAVAGMILRGPDGSVIFSAYCYLFNCNDALEAEVHALMIDLAIARQHMELPVLVQSDSSTALSCLSGSA
ncbi:hypothetical protein VPH35_014029 [Triticum aestivum]